MDTVLSMKHICKSFFGVPANDDISLEVASGEIHALLGENGAGKTTLMNILYGLYPYDRGMITWKGEPVIFRSPKDAIARNIGMVHQHFTLVPKLTVSQNITLGLHEKRYPFTDRKYLDKRLKAISERYGLAIEPSKEESLYFHDSFYFYPTVVFYHGTEKMFGAYLDTSFSGIELEAQKAEPIETETIPAGRFICAFHQGPYAGIKDTYRRACAVFPELAHEDEHISFNIIDQFVENDSANYITEIQIPIKEQAGTEN